ncbi:MAG: hypothetical protein CR994_07765 [Maribacter sp.]|nr:MAG: hypothetical protein CR994_07765 [Maribacter sp.]
MQLVAGKYKGGAWYRARNKGKPWLPFIPIPTVWAVKKINLNHLITRKSRFFIAEKEGFEPPEV